MLKKILNILKKENTTRFKVVKRKSFGYMIVPNEKIKKEDKLLIKTFNLQLSRFKGFKQKRLAHKFKKQLN